MSSCLPVTFECKVPAIFFRSELQISLINCHLFVQVFVCHITFESHLSKITCEVSSSYHPKIEPGTNMPGFIMTFSSYCNNFCKYQNIIKDIYFHQLVFVVVKLKLSHDVHILKLFYNFTLLLYECTFHMT